ncbi:hypothetical protein [Polycladidibacter hongkongensis]|uniref:hypothetical protein n=1 Tax=Polycladidibacter hongkongensis TaxID=1647556 RepID=UPI0008348840|nr:hypothetical protein [Pseudovibrio hongkongensis]
MRIPQAPQQPDMRREQTPLQNKERRSEGQVSSNKHGNARTSHGGDGYALDAFTLEMQAAKVGRAQGNGDAGGFSGEGSEEQGQGEGDLLDLAGARLLAATDPAEMRASPLSSPIELVVASRQGEAQARVDKTMAAIATQIEQTIRAEVAADKSGGKGLELSFEQSRFGITGLTLLSSPTGLSVVLTCAADEVNPAQLQSAAQSLIGALQSRFPEKKIRVLEKQAAEGEQLVTAVDEGLSSLSAVFAQRQS